MTYTLTLDALVALSGGRMGRTDAPCPACGPDRRNPLNRRRRVLRIWTEEPSFARYHCARCGVSGWARDDDAAPIDRGRLEALKVESDARDADYAARQRSKAAWLYGRAGPPRLARRYLAARGITCDLPATMRELRPLRDGHHVAMVMPNGIPDEIEPGVLGTIAKPASIHLTLLAPDGTAKAGTGRDKLMLGSSAGLPIVLAPPNDGLGLVIAEGIEDALSAHQATGLGAWAAGSATRLPALADHVPEYIECVTVLVDDDEAGRNNAGELVERLAARGIETITSQLGALD